MVAVPCKQASHGIVKQALPHHFTDKSAGPAVKSQPRATQRVNRRLTAQPELMAMGFRAHDKMAVVNTHTELPTPSPELDPAHVFSKRILARVQRDRYADHTHHAPGQAAATRARRNPAV